MMSQAVKEKSSYREAFEELSARAGGDAPAWLRELRARAFERFEERGFPTTDEEDWKYTNVSPLARAQFRPAERGAAPDPEAVESFVYEESRRSRLVFVDGFFRTDLSSLEAVAGDVSVADLLEASRGEHGEIIRQYLGDEGGGAGPFHDLNTAFLSGGAFVRVGAGVRVGAPIQFLFLSTASGRAAFPRVLVVADANSSATVIESYAALGAGEYFTDAVVESHIGDGAALHHYQVQVEGEGSYHVGSARARLGRGGASYDLTSIHLGARLSRHDIEVLMEEEGAECWVDGLYLLGDGQHHDTHSTIDHRAARCRSHQNYKGILDGRSRAVFNGRVFVRPGAQQTDAFQSNKNLLLSPDARVDTKPQLEIFADDVKCAHGATVGQLEEEELFYLVSRGLRPSLARNLLTYGFAEEIVGKIGVESIKRQLDEAILNRLHADFQAR